MMSETDPAGTAAAGIDPRRVFVVYGRDERARLAMFEFLRALDLQPAEWTALERVTERGSPSIGEILDQGMSEARAVVVLLTADDEARLRPDLVRESDPDYERSLTGQPRPNVLFEAGMALGRHPERTILVDLGGLRRPFSDVAGLLFVPLDDSPQSRHRLLARLKNAGCAVDDSGSDWLSAGVFEGGGSADQAAARDVRAAADGCLRRLRAIKQGSRAIANEEKWYLGDALDSYRNAINVDTSRFAAHIPIEERVRTAVLMKEDAADVDPNELDACIRELESVLG